MVTSLDPHARLPSHPHGQARDSSHGRVANDGLVGGRPVLVVRPRLLDRMEEATHPQVTVLTAPAGYGKTVLVEQWASRHPTRAVARLSLGADVTTGRIVEQAASMGDGVLVIDAPDATDVFERAGGLASLLGRLPGNVHTIVTQRAWKLSTSRLWSERGHLAIIGAAELAFTPEETRVLVRRGADRELTDAQLEALMARTMGWPAAVNVATVALAGCTDPDRVIEDLRGTDKRIAAYLREEVLAKQPPAVRRFLVRTSVLDTLTAPDCAKVTEDPAAGMMLRYLGWRGTFLLPVPSGGRAYVHHPLFRDVLRHELRAGDPETERALLLRAALCHLQRGEPERAGAYLAEAEDWDRLIDLVDRHGDALLTRDKADLTLGWLDRVPRSSPRRAGAMLRRALILILLGRAVDVVDMLRDIERLQATDRTRQMLDALRATSVFGDALPEGVVGAVGATADAPDLRSGEASSSPLGITTGALRAMAEGSRARAEWYAGEVEVSRWRFTDVLSRPDIHPAWRLQLLSALALLEAWEGDMGGSHAHAMHALLVARSQVPDHPGALEAHLALAHIARQQGDLVRAGALLDRSEAIAARLRRSVPLAVCAYERSCWHLAGGCPARGLAELDGFRAIGTSLPSIVESRLRGAETQLRLALSAKEVPAPLPTTGRSGRETDLSPREIEVVRFLPTTLSNAEIAEQLFVSLNTLKTHLRTVYRKLGVTSRSEAIVRAEKLGLA